MITQTRPIIGGLATLACSLLLLSTTALAQTGPPINGVTGTVALEGTVDPASAGVNLVTTSAIDGTRRLFHLTKKLVVHGGKATDDALSGLRAGSRVVVHYSGSEANAAVEEVDLIGDGGLKTTEGIVTNIDRGRKEITIRLENAKTETLQLTERAAHDVGRDVEESGRITVYYSDEAGKKVAHFFRRAS